MSFNFDFKVVTPTRYECVLSSDVKNRMMSSIFQKTRAKLNKKSGGLLDLDGADPERKDSFEIEARFLNLVGTALHKPIKDVVNQVGEDGIVVMTNNIDKAWFERKVDKNWLLKVKITGDFSDER